MQLLLDTHYSTLPRKVKLNNSKRCKDLWRSIYVLVMSRIFPKNATMLQDKGKELAAHKLINCSPT